MKKTKISFQWMLLIISLVGTLSVSAEKLKVRTVTDCFQTVLLQNVSNTSTYAPAQTDFAAFVNNMIVTNQIKYLKQLPSKPVEGCTETERFCCATFTEAPAGTPGTVPTLTIGGVSAKWQVNQIKYHN